MIKRFKIISSLLLIQFLVVSSSIGEEKKVKDCFEKINRATFAFNMALDKVLFRPVATGYRKLPSPIRTGTSNALNNLSNLVTIPNNVLQGDIKAAGNNTIRFIINSTLGIVGIFDPANALGFEKLEKEDFGQTFGAMGIGEGCYLVLPVIGPSTVRDAVGSLVSLSGGDAWYNVTVKNDTQYFKESDYYFSKLTEGVDFRAKNLESLDSLEKTSVDFYATVRSLYLQDRERKIKNLKERTETLDDSDWDSIDK
ncbi:VacJ family lipoprotein [Candidatus Pelagibacter sp.]|nr:VacJ family lipoprotein [Candidatus Pelagibacter sp.]